MDELTATVAETRANFSKIASTVNALGRPVTVFKNSKPWVLVAPVGKGYGDRIPNIDWSSEDVVRMGASSHVTVLPADWDDPEDEGLYDDLA